MNPSPSPFPLFHIAPTPNSHLGAFASSPILKGMTVLLDTPLFTLDAPFQAYLYQRVQRGASGPTPIEGEEEEEGNVPPTLEEWFEKQIQRSLVNNESTEGSKRSLSPNLTSPFPNPSRTPTEINQFYTLSNMHPSQPRAYAIFLTNAVSLSESTTGGLFPLLSRFNSSCRPNLSRPHWSSKTRKMQLIAVRDIEEGEELVWPYLGIPFEFDSPQSRRAQLKQIFGFDCACRACTEWTPPSTDNNADATLAEPSPKLKASEARLRELRRLKQMIDMGGQRVLRKMQQISQEEGLWEMSDRLGFEANRVGRGEERRGWDHDSNLHEDEEKRR
ncbi:BZ3500_MvSof-1268-A1-R1_Chr7-2g09504 [Microbotryum saponariae]|uniref:BZ3500_MvSof-1268-A1-R1_Chr7-2g09504 protein n=1 Tax=Microbotryum saponariae TaxID=289078 RepID=A0A2X0L750_9BASI|nr:BZ3501_MvSof-1269-A2-R1_Chr7-1g09204 [Microbotryum saponariae]SDA02581.1 BZ3500_MvSof-1268-A1-R1_Chr7-2g09504 [Microbotryum saponariae]